MIAVQTQGANIESYSNYLAARAKAYASTKQDHARDDAVRRLRDLSIDRGLLRETEDILLQIRALLKCGVGSPASDRHQTDQPRASWKNAPTQLPLEPGCCCSRT